MAFISEEDLENPHIRYFDHLNPEWSKVCIPSVHPTLHAIELIHSESTKRFA